MAEFWNSKDNEKAFYPSRGILSFPVKFHAKTAKLRAKAAKNFVSDWDLALVIWNFLKWFPADPADFRRTILQSLINQSPINQSPINQSPINQSPINLFEIWPTSAEASAGKNLVPGIYEPCKN